MADIAKLFGDLCPADQIAFVRAIPGLWHSTITESAVSVLTAAEELHLSTHCDIMTGLPIELTPLVLQYLDFRSMIAFAQVSRSYRAIANQPSARDILLARLGVAGHDAAHDAAQDAALLSRVFDKEARWQRSDLLTWMVPPNSTNYTSGAACRLRQGHVLVSSINPECSMTLLDVTGFQAGRVLHRFTDSQGLRISYVDFSRVHGAVAAAHPYRSTVSVWPLDILEFNQRDLGGSANVIPASIEWTLRFVAHTERLTALTLSQDARLPWIVTASAENWITVWSVATGAPLHTLQLRTAQPPMSLHIRPPPQVSTDPGIVGQILVVTDRFAECVLVTVRDDGPAVWTMVYDCAEDPDRMPDLLAKFVLQPQETVCHMQSRARFTGVSSNRVFSWSVGENSSQLSYARHNGDLVLSNTSTARKGLHHLPYASSVDFDDDSVVVTSSQGLVHVASSTRG